MGIIYRIHNKISNKSYVGKTDYTFDVRYPNGRFWAATHNKKLQDDCYRLGEVAMDVSILLESDYISGAKLEELEYWFIDQLECYEPNGYNKRRRKFSNLNDHMKSNHSVIFEDWAESNRVKIKKWEFEKAAFEERISNLEKHLSSKSMTEDTSNLLKSIIFAVLQGALSLIAGINKDPDYAFLNSFLTDTSDERELLNCLGLIGGYGAYNILHFRLKAEDSSSLEKIILEEVIQTIVCVMQECEGYLSQNLKRHPQVAEKFDEFLTRYADYFEHFKRANRKAGRIRLFC